MDTLSVVVPVYDEAGNIAGVVREVVRHLRGRLPFDLICVDDASEDGTLDALMALQAEVPELRVVIHRARYGQSAAIRTGVKHATGAWVTTLDGDGQNDPADILKLLEAQRRDGPQVRLYTGWRVNREDGPGKRWASRWANRIRRRLLRDDTPDTGCGIKLFERAAFLDLPYFDHMHRYLPALMQRAGWQTRSVPVSHRRRGAGKSKYTNIGRAVVGIRDLLGVSWLIRRSHVAVTRELEPHRGRGPG